MKKLFSGAAVPAIICLLFFGCGRLDKTPRIVPGEGISLSKITALAFNSEGSGFVSAAEDGLLRVWDICSGLVSVSDSASGLKEYEAAIEQTAFPVMSPDRSKKIFPSDDGGICLLDAATGKELARYYGIGPADGISADFNSYEWICMVPEGFFNASFRGSSFLVAEAGNRRYSLMQLSGALFRPDLFFACLSDGGYQSFVSELPLTLENLFEKSKDPPIVSLSFTEGSGKLKIKITGQNGGVGSIALYRRIGGLEIPAGLIDPETRAGRKFSERGRTCYEIDLDFNSAFFALGNYARGDIGVSAFNESGTIESDIIWTVLPEPDNPPAAGDFGITGSYDEIDAAFSAPALRAFLASDKVPEDFEALRKFLSLQAEGALYPEVELMNLTGGDFSLGNFQKTMDKLCAEVKGNDTVFLYLRGKGLADSLGDLLIIAGNKGEEISGDKILQSIPGFFSRSILLLDLESDAPQIQIETALLRFRQRLGPMAMLAAFGETEDVFIHSVMEGFKPPLPGTPDDGSKFMGIMEFFNRTGRILASQGARYLTGFPPPENFPLADLFINTGELKFQTMASGMLKIDRIDQNPIPLIFGETMIRRLPAGSYIIDMIYRNGYRETRFVDLRIKDSTWVIFNYTPALLTGNHSGTIPSNGINVAELNPANYQKINREAMEGMGMAPFYVAYLAGEKFYREGSYDLAIAEYNRAISLKGDYTDAYISRGNARRRSGNQDGAIDDYSRALRLKNGNADVHNYRGFVYTQKGDYNRAVEDYTQAIRNKDDYGDAYYNRAYVYSKQGKWDLAIADYTQVIKLEPLNASAYNGRGNAWQSKGDKNRAEDDFAAAARLNGH